MNEERLTELIDIYLGLLAERQLQRQIAGLVLPDQQQAGDEGGEAESDASPQDRRAIAGFPPPAAQTQPKGGKTPRYKSGAKAIGSGNQQHPGNGPYQSGQYGGQQS